MLYIYRSYTFIEAILRLAMVNITFYFIILYFNFVIKILLHIDLVLQLGSYVKVYGGITPYDKNKRKLINKARLIKKCYFKFLKNIFYI